MNLLQSVLQFLDEIYALVAVAIVCYWRRGVSEAGHLEELVVVVRVARAGQALIAERDCSSACSSLLCFFYLIFVALSNAHQGYRLPVTLVLFLDLVEYQHNVVQFPHCQSQTLCLFCQNSNSLLHCPSCLILCLLLKLKVESQLINIVP